MQREVFARIGMSDTSFALAPARASVREHNVAAGHAANGNPIAGDRNRYPESAAAGAYTNVLDLARMIIFINRGGTVGRTRWLTQARITDLLTPQHRFTASGNRGLGVVLNRRVRRAQLGFNYQHGGTNAGFRAAFIGYPNRNTGVAVMTNGSDPTLRWDVANAVARAYGWAADT
jgi:CubicO group peptidase (beta-lactamase class C family)